jgi:hypothetical protein
MNRRFLCEESDNSYPSDFRSPEVYTALEALAGSDNVATAGLRIAQMIRENPECIVPYLKPEHVQVLTDLMAVLQCQRMMLCTFCFIVQLMGRQSSICELLKRNRFLEIVRRILEVAQDDETKRLVIYLTAYVIAEPEAFPQLLCESGIVEQILQLRVEESSYEARCYFVRTASKFALPDPQQQDLIDLLFAMCFESEPLSVRTGLKGLNRVIAHDYGPLQEIMSHGHLIHRFTECLGSKYAEVRIASAALLVTCVQVPDFPASEFVKYGTATVIFECLESSDERLKDLCVTVLRYLFMLETTDDILIIASQFRDCNHSNIFSAASFDVKARLLTLYQSIIGKMSQTLLESFYSPVWVESLCSLMTVDDMKIANIVVHSLEMLRARAPPEIVRQLSDIITRTLDIDQLHELCNSPDPLDGEIAARLNFFLTSIVTPPHP